MVNDAMFRVEFTSRSCPSTPALGCNRFADRPGWFVQRRGCGRRAWSPRRRPVEVTESAPRSWLSRYVPFFVLLGLERDAAEVLAMCDGRGEVHVSTNCREDRLDPDSGSERVIIVGPTGASAVTGGIGGAAFSAPRLWP